MCRCEPNKTQPHNSQCHLPRRHYIKMHNTARVFTFCNIMVTTVSTDQLLNCCFRSNSFTLSATLGTSWNPSRSVPHSRYFHFRIGLVALFFTAFDLVCVCVGVLYAFSHSTHPCVFAVLNVILNCGCSAKISILRILRVTSISVSFLFFVEFRDNELSVHEFSELWIFKGQVLVLFVRFLCLFYGVYIPFSWKSYSPIKKRLD